MMPDSAQPRAFALVSALAWAFASCVTACAAHGLIGLFSGAYADRAHPAVGPVALGALILGLSALLAAALRSLAGSGTYAPLAAARRFGALPAAPAWIAVALGGLAVLLGMEFAEQFAAAGRIEGAADALGGNVALGAALVAGLAAGLTLSALRFAQRLAGAAVAVAEAILAWVGIAKPSAAPALARGARFRHSRRHASLPAYLAHASGLRAPPPPLA
jgi:hypothetical protein